MTPEEKKQVIIDYLYEMILPCPISFDPFGIGDHLKQFKQMSDDEKVKFILEREKDV